MRPQKMYVAPPLPVDTVGIAYKLASREALANESATYSYDYDPSLDTGWERWTCTSKAEAISLVRYKLRDRDVAEKPWEYEYLGTTKFARKSWLDPVTGYSVANINLVAARSANLRKSGYTVAIRMEDYA